MISDNELIARRIFRDQVRKELLDDILEYKVGMIIRGELIVKKNAPIDGMVFIIPDKEYHDLFKEP